jgi:hypothetical protein
MQFQNQTISEAHSSSWKRFCKSIVEEEKTKKELEDLSKVLLTLQMNGKPEDEDDKSDDKSDDK